MEVFENPMFFASLVIGAVVLAGISSAYQVYGPDSEGSVKPKAVLRDGLLGLIFTAMAWTFIPESMNSLAKTVTTVNSAVSSTVGDYDVQIGPARF